MEPYPPRAARHGASHLTIQVDQGTLRSGEVPLVVTFDVRGGAGLSIFEEIVYLPRFATLSWRLATAERVLASGSIAGREADDRRLDLVLTSSPGVYRLPFLAAFGSGSRLVDLNPAALPTQPAAYDGVRGLLIDGTAAAPRLEAWLRRWRAAWRWYCSGPFPAATTRSRSYWRGVRPRAWAPVRSSPWRGSPRLPLRRWRHSNCPTGRRCRRSSCVNPSSRLPRR